MHPNGLMVDPNITIVPQRFGTNNGTTKPKEEENIWSHQATFEREKCLEGG